jgi:hypothetical protein
MTVRLPDILHEMEIKSSFQTRLIIYLFIRQVSDLYDRL